MTAAPRTPRAVCIGVHIVDAVGRPVTEIPPGQGRALLDEIRITAAGTAAGTALTLAKLGVQVSTMGAVGDDGLADFLSEQLRRSGIDPSRLARKPGVQTSATLLPIRPNGERPALHCPGATSLLAAEDIDLDAVRGADIVHLGGPDVCGSFGGEPALLVLREARAHGAITSIDVLSRGDGMTWEQLSTLLSVTDYFMPNDEQLRLYTGIDDLEQAAAHALTTGVGTVLVSAGPNGCLLADGDGMQWIPALGESVVDSTGCGDAVSAAFLAAVARGWPRVDAAWLGMAAASLVGAALGSDAGDFDFAGAATLAAEHAPAPVAGRVRAFLSAQPGESSPDGLPRYAQLPPAPHGGRSAWGMFGPEDNVGMFNLQDPARIAAAARLVRTGELFSLNAPIDIPDPPLFARGAPERHLHGSVTRGGYDDHLDNFYPQASSQWDALSHIAYAPGTFYNGVTNAQIEAGQRNTIDHWARRGIAGRALLLDVDALLGGAGAGFDPSATRAITVAELEQARRAAGVEYEPGDVWLLHTGYLAWHLAQDEATRTRLADTATLSSVGLERSEEMAAYLWDARVAGIGADNPALEVWPNQLDGGTWGFLHRMLIGQFGMGIGELWWLHDVARSCRGDGRYEMFLTSAPINNPGGVGSPANALVIK